MATLYDDRYVPMPQARTGQGWFYMALGLWLFVSPWVLGFAQVQYPTAPGAEFAGSVIALVRGPANSAAAASWNAWILGAVICALGATLAAKLRSFQDQVVLVLGAWLFAAPWVLGFNTWWPSASWDHWMTGLIVFLIAAACVPTAYNPR